MKRFKAFKEQCNTPVSAAAIVGTLCFSWGQKYDIILPGAQPDVLLRQKSIWILLLFYTFHWKSKDFKSFYIFYSGPERDLFQVSFRHLLDLYLDLFRTPNGNRE